MSIKNKITFFGGSGPCNMRSWNLLYWNSKFYRRRQTRFVLGLAKMFKKPQWNIRINLVKGKKCNLGSHFMNSQCMNPGNEIFAVSQRLSHLIDPLLKQFQKYIVLFWKLAKFLLMLAYLLNFHVCCIYMDGFAQELGGEELLWTQVSEFGIFRDV